MESDRALNPCSASACGNRDLVVVLEHPVRVGAVHLARRPASRTGRARPRGAHPCSRRRTTWIPSDSANRISLCHTAGTRSNTPSTMAMARGRRSAARRTSPWPAGGRYSASSTGPGLVVGQGRPEEHDDLRHDASRNAPSARARDVGVDLVGPALHPGHDHPNDGDARPPAASGRRGSPRRTPAARSRSSSWVTSVVDGRPRNVRHVGERPARPSFEARPCASRCASRVLHLPVVARRAVVAAAGDQREPALGRLCQGARQRHPAIGMTAAAHRRGEAPRPVGAAVDDRHREHRQTDFRRQVRTP